MAEDDELEKLKEEKMEELQSGDSEASQEEAMEEQKKQIWQQARSYLTSEAASRLSNIKAVDEDKALAIAQQVSRLGQMDQIGKINDEKMKEILKSIEEEKKGNESNIKFRK